MRTSTFFWIASWGGRPSWWPACWGGRASFARGVERIAAHAPREGTWTLLPGTDTLDVELAALSSVAVPVAHEAAARAGGGSVGLPAALQYMAGPDGACVDVLISTMSFAMGGINPDGPTMAGWSVEALERFDVAVLQAVLAGSQSTMSFAMGGINPDGPNHAGVMAKTSPTTTGWHVCTAIAIRACSRKPPGPVSSLGHRGAFLAVWSLWQLPADMGGGHCA
jgi:hypothetical protein